jgi:hypothetical protein
MDKKSLKFCLFIIRYIDLLVAAHPIWDASVAPMPDTLSSLAPASIQLQSHVGPRMRGDHPSPLYFTCPHAHTTSVRPWWHGDLRRRTSSNICFPEIYFWKIQMKHLQHTSETDETLKTCVYRHSNMYKCNTISTFETSKWNIYNIRLK